MEFIKYPDTNSLRHVCKQATYDFKDVDQYPLLPFRGSVKTHGTHSTIVSKGGETWLQSRNRIVTCSSDNSGFANFMSKIDVAALISLVDAPADSEVMIAGEFCGQGIMHGIAVAQLPKFLMIFGVKINGIWQDPTLFSHVRLPDNRIFNARDFQTFDTDIDLNKPDQETERIMKQVFEVERECPVGKALGVSGTGEGIVFVPGGWEAGSSHAQHTSRYFLKFKGDEHKNVNVNQLKQFDKEQAAKNFKEKTHDFVEAVVTEHRMQQGLEYLKEMQLPLEMKNIGTFLKWLSDDIVKEEGDLMEQYDLDAKLVKKAVTLKGQPWYKSAAA